MMYLYAITDLPKLPVPAVHGLGSTDENKTQPYNLTCGDIAAVVSPLSTNDVPPTETNLWHHERIVEALMTNHTVLPMRFGTVLADEAAVRTVLESYYPNFLAILEQVRGRVELCLRVLWDNAKERSTGTEAQRHRFDSPLHSIEESGRRYLLNRLEEEHQNRAWRQQMEALAEEVHIPLSLLAVESTRQVLLTPRLLLTAAYLVERDRVQTFQKEVDALDIVHPALHFLFTGPWPPYNFVTETIPK